MKILYVTSEANPFMASGGLGDVMGALPQAMKEVCVLNEVSVIMPLYRKMKEEYRAKLEKVTDISFSLAWRSTGASIYRIERVELTTSSLKTIIISTEATSFTENTTTASALRSSRWLSLSL